MIPLAIVDDVGGQFALGAESADFAVGAEFSECFALNDHAPADEPNLDDLRERLLSGPADGVDPDPTVVDDDHVSANVSLMSDTVSSSTQPLEQNPNPSPTDAVKSELDDVTEDRQTHQATLVQSLIESRSTSVESGAVQTISAVFPLSRIGFDARMTEARFRPEVRPNLAISRTVEQSVTLIPSDRLTLKVPLPDQNPDSKPEPSGMMRANERLEVIAPAPQAVSAPTTTVQQPVLAAIPTQQPLQNRLADSMPIVETVADGAMAGGGTERPVHVVAGSSVTSASPDTARAVAQQLVVALSRNANGTTELRLNPEELGRVRLNMTIIEGAVTVNVAAERPETADLMRRHIEVLADEFREMGYEDVSFSFDQGDRQSEAADADYPENQSINTDDSPAEIALGQQKMTGQVTIGLDLRL